MLMLTCWWFSERPCRYKKITAAKERGANEKIREL
jgi:hypothetical protein